MVVYRLKVGKNCKDSSLKKSERGLSVFLIKFSTPKLLRVSIQTSLNPKVILKTLNSQLFRSELTKFKNCRANNRYAHRLMSFLK